MLILVLAWLTFFTLCFIFNPLFTLFSLFLKGSLYRLFEYLKLFTLLSVTLFIHIFISTFEWNYWFSKKTQRLTAQGDFYLITWLVKTEAIMKFTVLSLDIPFALKCLSSDITLILRWVSETVIFEFLPEDVLWSIITLKVDWNLPFWHLFLWSCIIFMSKLDQVLGELSL